MKMHLTDRNDLSTSPNYIGLLKNKTPIAS